jgi:phage shock protein PspC (stress-responsive transcriptional regulator)
VLRGVFFAKEKNNVIAFPIFTEQVFMKPLYNIKNYIEWQAFGVCTSIGERLGIATSRIRLWFIYISFLTLGSPVIIYMILAFWKNLKNYVGLSRRNPLRWL